MRPFVDPSGKLPSKFRSAFLLKLHEPFAGFEYREVVERLRAHGFIFDRPAKGSHEIWYNPQTKRRTTLPHHPGTLPRGTLRAIISQCGLSVEEFLK